MKKITARYDPGTAFLCYPRKTAYFMGPWPRERSGVNPIASFQTPLRVPFSNPHSYCVLSEPIRWVTEPAPLEENRNVSFFTGNLRYSGTIMHSTIF